VGPCGWLVQVVGDQLLGSYQVVWVLGGGNTLLLCADRDYRPLAS